MHLHSIDRLARNLEKLQSIITKQNAEDVTVMFHREGFSFVAGATDSMSKLMLSMMGAFAELERALLLESQREGIAEARKRSAYGNVGRKKALKDAQIQEIHSRFSKGEKASHLAKEYKISRTTLYGYLKGTKMRA